MEKKKYTKPGIVKVELNHEQAVLGTCSTLVATRVAGTLGCLGNECRQSNRAGDSLASS